MVAALAVVCLVLSSNSALAGCGHWRAVHGGWHGHGYGYGCNSGGSYGWNSGGSYGWNYGGSYGWNYGGSYGWNYGGSYGWNYGRSDYPGYVYTPSRWSPCATGCGWSWNSCWNSCRSSCYRPYGNSWYSPSWSYYGVASDHRDGGLLVRRSSAGQQARDEAPAPTTDDRPPQDGVLLSLDVPQDARVYVNGTLTKTSGTHRQYVCSGLLPGSRYAYHVQVVVTRNGKELSDTQVVRFRAGETRDLAFDLGANPAATVAARLR
jgi:uncharacterized protein (TIGR03000 family)